MTAPRKSIHTQCVHAGCKPDPRTGAIMTPDTLARAAAKGISAKAMLANNDGYNFFKSIDDLVVTGATRTNVNDFRAILILDDAQ